MSIRNYEARMNSFRDNSLINDNSPIKDILDINAYSTPVQISTYIGFKMKEFMEEQLGKKSLPTSTMGKLTQVYETSTEAKEVQESTRQEYEEIIKKTTKPKQRGSK